MWDLKDITMKYIGQWWCLKLWRQTNKEARAIKQQQLPSLDISLLEGVGACKRGLTTSVSSDVPSWSTFSIFQVFPNSNLDFVHFKYYFGNMLPTSVSSDPILCFVFLYSTSRLLQNWDFVHHIIHFYAMYVLMFEIIFSSCRQISEFLYSSKLLRDMLTESHWDPSIFLTFRHNDFLRVNCPYFWLGGCHFSFLFFPPTTAKVSNFHRSNFQTDATPPPTWQPSPNLKSTKIFFLSHLRVCGR